jgi:hypothetical protein
MNKKTKWFFLSLIAILLISSLLSSLVHALPAGPNVNYIRNTTATVGAGNRSTDIKGTITTITLDNNQQDQKWKAYVGNISGKLALDDANAKTIYDWTLGAPQGEVYVTRHQGTINWGNVSCANAATISSEEGALGMGPTLVDNINHTFNQSAHMAFNISTKPIGAGACRATATYVNDTAIPLTASSSFQEILMQDDITNAIIYTTLISPANLSFDGGTVDFQLLVAENESATVPTMYFFYVELGS